MPFAHHWFVLCNGGRAIGVSGISTDSCFVEATTGTFIGRAPPADVAVDTSGAIAWSADGALVASGGPERRSCVVMSAPAAERVYHFSYGVCLPAKGTQCQVVRFDFSPVEPDPDVGI